MSAATAEIIEQDVELVDLSNLVDELYAEDQVERPGIICEIAA
ncbi:hypothetical protein P3T37_000011 [Kitasatospora sp. MAA4]|nr:hypothetical protein [Kitasatospora sp. MAA4]MDH6130644.1 hypothetical protein [Kitasatospora sp. MAA4]